jgi:hypothetical protein
MACGIKKAPTNLWPVGASNFCSPISFLLSRFKGALRYLINLLDRVLQLHYLTATLQNRSTSLPGP